MKPEFCDHERLRRVALCESRLAVFEEERSEHPVRVRKIAMRCEQVGRLKIRIVLDAGLEPFESGGIIASDDLDIEPPAGKFGFDEAMKLDIPFEWISQLDEMGIGLIGERPLPYAGEAPGFDQMLHQRSDGLGHFCGAAEGIVHFPFDAGHIDGGANALIQLEGAVMALHVGAVEGE